MARPARVSIKGTRGDDTIAVVSNGVVVNGVLRSATPEQLAAGVTINGDAGNDHITGGSGVDQLIGFGGSDTLIGGGGLDSLSGGDGNDTLIDAVDGATFDGGNGVDLLDLSSTTRNIKIDLQGTGSIFLDINLDRDPFNVGGVLPEAITGRITGIENLRTGSGNDELSGNSSANVLEAGAGADSLWGRGGNDTLLGGEGDDHLSGEQGSDLLYGGPGADVFYGTAGSGHDTVMDYGAGDRVYFFNAARPTQWTLSGDGQSLVGIFDGGASSITILNVTDISQVIIAGQIVGTSGDDTLSSTGDYDQLSGGAGNDRLLGNGGDDQLFGESGNDLLDGGSGVDRSWGGIGNDRFIVDNAADEAWESSGGGDDWVLTLVSYSLVSGSEVETLSTTNAAGTTPIVLTGNNFGNSVYGNAGANSINGLGGSDYLAGLEGNDAIDGGTGNDFLRGGAGDDRFVFQGAAGNDTVLDFESGADQIDLSAYGITADQVTSATSGSDTVLSIDTDMDGTADFTITLTGVGAPSGGDYIF